MLPTARLAHPRSRWENMQAAMQLTRDNGSSPLTRGKHSPCLPVHTLVGLIPAHAGKTVDEVFGSFSSRAHPRSRGENISRRPATVAKRGSSPLTRGKPSRQLEDLARQRLIPAHAGKTYLTPNTN